MTDSFWRDPPWRGGKGGYRMGLRPIQPQRWLSARISDAERSRKQQLLDEPSATVFAALEGSRPGQQKIFDAVAEFIDAQPGHRRDITQPLVSAALLVPDDLCLMERDADSYRLTAACVCAPSYWQLTEKIGRTLEGIHGPVPTLNDKLGPTMLQFFDRLPDGAVFERRNWLIHTNPEPYQPRSETWQTVAQEGAEKLVVRSERQTLRRLDPTAVVFTIRVSCHPLIEIVSHREAARDMLSALETMDPAERSATGYRFFGAAVTSLLQSVT